MKDETMTEAATLPNGCMLYFTVGPIGNRVYWSDEIGGGVHVWDTALVAESTLLSAILHEQKLLYQEAMQKKEKV